MKETERHVRLITRTCRGPAILDVKARSDYFSRWREVDKRRDFAAGIRLNSLLEEKLKRQHTGIPKGDWDMLFRLVGSLIGSRKGCGYDFNQTILAGPLDGREHKYQCPRCGVSGVYTAPRFD